MYQFSLKAYSVVFKDALAKADTADDLESRINNLLDSITFQVMIDFIISTNLTTNTAASQLYCFFAIYILQKIKQYVTDYCCGLIFSTLNNFLVYATKILFFSSGPKFCCS